MKTAIKEILRALLIMARILLCLPLAAAWLVLYWTLFFGWGTKQADKFVVMCADMCAGTGVEHARAARAYCRGVSLRVRVI